MKPDYQSRDGSIRLYHADALRVMAELPPRSVHQVLADPPYASGGRTLAEKARPTTRKYNHGGSAYHGFEGDHRDQRSWTAWMTLWLVTAARCLREGAYAHVFTDWRQLPATTDAVQMAGLRWRGLIAWDKGGGARAGNKSYHRHQCEYVAWGTRGPLPLRADAGPFPGCYTVDVAARAKLHPTAKPVALLEQLVRVAPPRGVVLDPFLGSGTTAVACLRQGRRFVGCETSDHYFAAAVDRVRALLGEQARAVRAA